ncbi:MAG: asparagine synthase (glutamine-hydrolyzing) [Candidatus Anstonellales archaeon]
MCGIAGFYLPKNLRAQPSILKKMADALVHRGPDAEGFFLEGPVGLASRRLSIIDIKGGNQPIYSADKNYVIIYNGEVYNFREIRKELERDGVAFATNSDTEVILQSHAFWGDDAVKKFNGMFAYALYERMSSRLLLARDRLGIKPLHYSHQENGIFFASEIKSLLASGAVEPKPNYQAILEYLAFQNIFSDKTFFDGVKNLPPGHIAIIEHGKIQLKKYFEPSFFYANRTVEEDASLFLKTAREAVKRHMIADVPVGCYLSGGFDSTTVTALACEVGKSRINSFTGYFGDKRYDEIDCAEAVAKKSGAKMHKIKITPKDFVEDIEKIVYYMDEPIAAMTAFSHYEVAKAVSKHVKVILTGHGGDEFFAGYPIYKLCLYNTLVKKSPLSLITALVEGFDLREIPRLFYFLFFPLLSPEASTGLFVLFDENERRLLLTNDFYEKTKNFSPKKELEKEVGKADLYDPEYLTRLYIKCYLPSLFFVEDRVGMAHSIESRTPLCDNELVALSCSIPIERKLHKNRLKYIVKEAMKGILPEILYRQSKKGFPTPLADWFRRSPIKDYVYSIFTSDKFKSRGIFNPDYCLHLLNSHCKSKPLFLDSELVTANKLWSILMVELWFRTFIDKPST